MSTEQNVKHLWDCAQVFDAATHAKKLLKSYYICTSRKLAGTNDAIPLERFATSQMCEHCSMHWHDNYFHMKLKPQIVDIKTSKARRLIAKLKAQESGKEKGLLSKKQKKRAKWLLKNAQSKVEIKCEFCQHKSYLTLNKPIKQKTKNILIENKVEETTEMDTTNSKNKKNKSKNKKKDKNAGLKIPNIIKDKTKQKPLETKVENTDTVVTSSVSSKISNPLNVNSKKAKSKNSKKSNDNASKVQSKTQKQNAILQLAALLKSQDQTKKSTSNSAKNRMESFLE